MSYTELNLLMLGVAYMMWKSEKCHLQKRLFPFPMWISIVLLYLQTFKWFYNILGKPFCGNIQTY